MIFLTIVLLSIFAYVIYSCYKYFSMDIHLKNIPGPKQLPFFKNTIDFMTKPMLVAYGDWFKEFGDTVQLDTVCGSAQLATCDANLVQFVLTSSELLTKGSTYRYLKSWLGNGLITSSNPEWRQHRKLITPSFHLKMLESFLTGFHSFEESLISALENEIGKDAVDILPVVGVHTLAMICSTAMGTDIVDKSKFLANVNKLIKINTTRITSPLKSQDLTYYFTTTYKEEKENFDSLCKYTNFIISSRKKRVEETPSLINLTIDETGSKTKLSFLDTLLKQQIESNYLSDDDIREEVLTFMAAGYETTASTISYLLYNLAQYPAVQEKVVEELRWIFGDNKHRQITKDDMNQMKYLEMAIKETLRLYPVAPIIARSPTEIIPYENTTIPKGIDIIISIYHLHRNPKLYQDPERFDPERFSLENAKTRHPFAYIPFSGGMRNCIGQRYAYIKIKSIVSKILRNFEILKSPTDKGLQLSGDVVLRSINGINVSLKKRKF